MCNIKHIASLVILLKIITIGDLIRFQPKNILEKFGVIIIIYINYY